MVFAEVSAEDDGREVEVLYRGRLQDEGTKRTLNTTQSLEYNVIIIIIIIIIISAH